MKGIMRSSRRATLVALLVLAGICLALFGSVLFGPGGRVISIAGADLSNQMYYWYEFGFSQLRQGRFPLWNPHTFSGSAFYGTFQTGLLYPLNGHFLFLPVDRAVNISVAAHVFLLGAFTFFWMRFRGLGVVAGATAGAIVMLSGPAFLHVYCGYLGAVQAMAWAPLVLLAVEGTARRGEWRWPVLGMWAVAMQVLAGAPQYVYITALAAGIYAGILWIAGGCKAATAARLLAIYLGGAALSAVEWCAGIEAAGESVRGGGVSRAFAGLFSLPPENLVTLFVPRFFGDIGALEYWGRGYLWEMCLFVGASGMLLAVYGAVRGERLTARAGAAVAAVMLVFALGSYTPLFDLLYRWLPWFSHFRGASKFAFAAVLFIAALAAAGLDRLMREAPPRAVVVAVVIAVCVAAVAAGCLRLAGEDGAWLSFIASQGGSPDDYAAELRGDRAFAARARDFAAAQLLVCAGVLALAAFLLGAGRRRAGLVYGMAVLAGVEMVAFAWSYRATFPVSTVRCEFAAQHMAGLGRDDRVLIRPKPNAAMAEGLHDIWGFGPLVNRRYAEFMTLTQGKDPDRATQYLEVRRVMKLHTMLRCRSVITGSDGEYRASDNPESFPRLALIGQCRVARERNDIFRALATPGFDPAREVILEEAPSPMPAAGAGGTAEVVGETTDRLLIRVETSQPAVLLISDAYAAGWRARPAAPGPQAEYKVLPANYVLRGIPLAAGRHLIRVGYDPPGFRVGFWISIAALAAMVAAGVVWRWRRRGAGAAQLAQNSAMGPA